MLVGPSDRHRAEIPMSHKRNTPKNYFSRPVKSSKHAVAHCGVQSLVHSFVNPYVNKRVSRRRIDSKLTSAQRNGSELRGLVAQRVA